MAWFRDFLIVIALLAVLAQGCQATYDNTDDAVNKHRSGVNLITDYGTGCQYLSAVFAGITPRLSSDGKPMCSTVERK